MQQTFSSAVPNRTRRSTGIYKFRAFYLTILCISLFTIASLGADWVARYRHGTQYGAAQRRALEELDITRLVKRDEEVCKISEYLILFLCGLPYANYGMLIIILTL